MNCLCLLKHTGVAVRLAAKALAARGCLRTMDLLDKDGECIHFFIDAHGKLKEPLSLQ